MIYMVQLLKVSLDQGVQLLNGHLVKVLEDEEQFHLVEFDGLMTALDQNI